MKLRQPMISFGIAICVMALFLPVSTRLLAGDEQRMIGNLTKISPASDGKSAEATLKDIKTSKEVILYVTNELVLDKFKYGKTVVGDQIRAKYERVNGKNRCTYFKKVAGE